MAEVTGNDDDFDDDDAGSDDELDPGTLAAAVVAGDRNDPGETDDETDDDDNLTSLAPSGGSPTGRSLATSPDLAQVLSGSLPLFLIHKGARNFDRLPEVLGRLPRVTHGNVGLGTVIRLPAHKPSSAQVFLDSMSRAPLRLADPEIWRRHGWPNASDISTRSAGYAPWLDAAPDPGSAVDTGWVDQVLDAQRAANATALLSASGWVSDRQGRSNLADAMRWVSASRDATATDEPMFVNLTLASGWLTAPALREALLEEIVESTEQYWYLRFFWPIVEPRYGQLHNPAILEGYKALATTAALEQKVLVLPNSGLTGWVATALGATGFSTGSSWTDQAFCDVRRFARQPGQPAPPARQRYFDRTILHTVERTDYEQVRGLAGHLRCRCRFSQELDVGPWNVGSSGFHYLVQAARQQSLLGSMNPRLEALRDVRRARGFVQARRTGPAAFTGDSNPTHLSMWETVLA